MVKNHCEFQSSGLARYGLSDVYTLFSAQGRAERSSVFIENIRVGFWQNGFFADFYF